jgi:hypothetical protein
VLEETQSLLPVTDAATFGLDEHLIDKRIAAFEFN